MKWLTPGQGVRVDLAVVIVSLEVRDFLLANLEALFASHGTISAEVIVVDNGSTDGTVAAVRERFPLVRVIANPRNRGFAGANAQGIAVQNARHVLLLNPDMRVASTALQMTVEYLDAHSDVGVASGRLLKEDGTTLETVRSFPTVWSQAAILLKLPHVWPHVLDRYLCRGFDYTREQAVDSVRGSYFAISGRALESCGPLDTRYFIWFEEVDYCRQISEYGLKVMHVPTIQATDFVGRFFVTRRRWWTQRHFTRSMLQYFAKWQPGWRVWLLWSLRPLALISAWIVDVISSGRLRPKNNRT